MASRKTSSKTTLGNSRIEKYYNKIVVAFILTTSVLVLAIIYFSFSKTVITVTTAHGEHDITAAAKLSELNAVGLVTEVEGSQIGTNVGTEKTKPAKAVGTVKIINNYTSNQPLIATTRLLSKEGVLFRTQETVTVPAGGSVEVAVIADQEGEEGNIGPSTFEIVALWPGLKEKIYAESGASMTGGLVNVAQLSEQEIQNVKKELRGRLFEDAEKKFNENMRGREDLPPNPVLLPVESFLVTVLLDEANAEAGQEVQSVEVTQKLSVQGIVIDRMKLEEIVQQTIAASVPQGEALAGTPTFNDFVLTVKNIATDGTVTGDVEVTSRYTTTVGGDHEAFKKENLVNKTEQEVQNYLRGFKEEVQDVTVSFSPFWVTRTPSLPDHITITVK